MKTLSLHFEDLPHEDVKIFEGCIRAWVSDLYAYTEIAGGHLGDTWFTLMCKPGSKDDLPIAATRTEALAMEVGRRCAQAVHDAAGTKAIGVGPLDGFELGFPQ